MTRILVVGPEHDGGALCRAPLAVHHGARVDAAAAACAAIVVVNDGTADTVRRLQDALELRAQRPRLRVAVLSFVDPSDPEVAACVGALNPLAGTLPFDQVRALLRADDARVRADVTEEAISFEYRV